MIRMALPIRTRNRDPEANALCRQNCDQCHTPCAKQGRYSKKGLTLGHLQIHFPQQESLDDELRMAPRPLP